MTDDDIERRLRAALHARAARIPAQGPRPAMAVPDEPTRALRVLPVLCAVVLVLVVVGATALVAGAHNRHGVGPRPQSVAAVASATSDLAPTATAPLTPPTMSPAASGPNAVTRSSSVASGPAGVPSIPSWRSVPATTAVSPTATASPSATFTTPPPTSGTQLPSGAPSSTPQRTSPQRTAPPSSIPTQRTGPSSGPSRPSTTSMPSTPTQKTTPSQPRTPSTAPSTSAPTTPPSSTGPGQVLACPGSSTTVAVGGDRLVGTHGGDYTFLNVTNHGVRCSLSGYPIVRIYNAAGTLIGGPAPQRTGAAPATVVLERGAQAQFEIYDVYSAPAACQGAATNTLRTLLPGQSTASVIDYGYSACQLSVTAVHRPTAQTPTQ